MKSLLTIMIAAFSFTSTLSYAGSTICAGEKIYYSYISADRGAPPSPGLWDSTSILIVNGEVLEKIVTHTGEGAYTINNYMTKFTDEVVRFSEGDPMTEIKVISEGIMEIKANPAAPGVSFETISEPVTCTVISRLSA